MSNDTVVRAAIKEAKLLQKVFDARAELMGAVAVFVTSDDAHNAALLKKVWKDYNAAQDQYYKFARDR